MTNFSQIKFGNTKVFRTFEVPKDFNGVVMLQHIDVVGFFYVHSSKYILHSKGGHISSIREIGLKSPLSLLAGELVAAFFATYNCQKINVMKFQTIKVNGKEHLLGGFFNIQNALLAYSYFKQLTGREFVAEMLEGDIKAQLDILQANNPNASPVLDVLRHAYEETKVVTDKMGYSNLFYPLSDN